MTALLRKATKKTGKTYEPQKKSLLENCLQKHSINVNPANCFASVIDTKRGFIRILAMLAKYFCFLKYLKSTRALFSISAWPDPRNSVVFNQNGTSTKTPARIKLHSFVELFLCILEISE